ncbi:telomere-protecting terminal protein Tpg [Streptomyces sp. NPDC057963]|uniref:telomere-protecting terminal protein Tpg n=1 Tax=Streptomyces sp. NPDC057963 TaxID=3346290 RepID=UPI0036ECD9F4
MGEIEDAIQRADQEAFTRQPPQGLKACINFLLRQMKTTKAVATELGVSQRSVERYRTGERKHPPKPIADRIEAAVRARWQPKARGRHRKQAATVTGITIETRARFGYTAPVGTTDDGRMRRLTVWAVEPAVMCNPVGSGAHRGAHRIGADFTATPVGWEWTPLR